MKNRNIMQRLVAVANHLKSEGHKNNLVQLLLDAAEEIDFLRSEALGKND